MIEFTTKSVKAENGPFYNRTVLPKISKVFKEHYIILKVCDAAPLSVPRVHPIIFKDQYVWHITNLSGGSSKVQTGNKLGSTTREISINQPWKGSTAQYYHAMTNITWQSHWDRMSNISKNAISINFSWMEIFEYQLNFHWRVPKGPVAYKPAVG